MARVLLFLLLTILVCSATHYSIDLGGNGWKVTSSNGSIAVAGNVPGDIFSDLLASDIIEEPYYRFNDDLQRWVGEDSWLYEKPFSLNSTVLDEQEIYLIFDGLDTVTTISINKKVIGTTDNQFRQYIFPVKDLLQESNLLSVQFESAPAYATNKQAAYPYTVPYSEYPDQQPHRNFIRKNQASFGWDWGPAFVPQGIYKPVRLVAFSTIYIESAAITVIPSGQSFNVSANLNITAATNCSGSFVLEIPNVGKQTLDANFVVGVSNFYISFLVPQNSVKLWWPNGYGTPYLYQLNVTWTPSEGSEPEVVITKQIGFRTLKLITDTYSNNPGTSFYFEVNGVSVFAKGANFIPADSFDSRVNKSVIQTILSSAVQANMNMVRNWGGGIYQTDYFYDTCDQLGLLVWEEFMFACAMYPRDDEFLDTVSKEVRHQVRRLVHHPCIVIWGGNNENEAALSWYPESSSNPYLYVVDQSVLYIDTVRENILHEDTTRPFLFSSPSNGALSENPYVHRWGNPYNGSYGDVHYYDYLNLCTDESNFPNARFVSEYGFPSYPSYYTWQGVTEPGDLTFNSTLMQHRIRHPDGIDQMIAQMQKHFRLPDLNSDDPQVFRDFVYLTQTVQSVCIKAQTEYYRRNRDTKYNTMGALYWQLNDIWQGQTWSSLEYGGRWKMLHYYAKDFFSNVLITSNYNASNIYNVWVVNDYLQNIQGMVTITLWSYQGNLLWQKKVSVNVPKQGSYNIPIPNILCPNQCYEPNQVFVTLSMTSSDILVTSNYYTFAPLAKVNLPQTFVQAEDFKQNGQAIQFTIFSPKPAPFVWIETPYSGYFSDNGLWLLPNIPDQITFYSPQPIDLEKFQSSLTLRTVVNIYS